MYICTLIANGMASVKAQEVGTETGKTENKISELQRRDWNTARLIPSNCYTVYT